MDVITRSVLLLSLLGALVPMTPPPLPASHGIVDAALPGDFSLTDASSAGHFPLAGLTPAHGGERQEPPALPSPSLAPALEDCDTCDVLPADVSAAPRWSGGLWMDLPRGESGEYHRDVVSIDS